MTDKFKKIVCLLEDTIPKERLRPNASANTREIRDRSHTSMIGYLTKEIIALFQPEIDAANEACRVAHECTIEANARLQAVEVKPLEWANYGRTIFGGSNGYKIVKRKNYWVVYLHGCEIQSKIKDLDEAKNYAYEFHRSETLYSVTPRPASEVAAEAREKARREAANIVRKIGDHRFSLSIQCGEDLHIGEGASIKFWLNDAAKYIESLITTDKGEG